MNNNRNLHSSESNPIILYPGSGYSYEDVVKAINNKKYYGDYYNLIIKDPKYRKYIETKIEKYFGPTVSIHKKRQEYKQGFLFPIKTKENISNFINNLNLNLNMIDYKVDKDNNKLYFPPSNIYSKSHLIKILKTILNNAKIPFKLIEYENKYFEKQHNNINEIKRLQQLAGITEIIVNNPTHKINIKFTPNFKTYGQIYQNENPFLKLEKDYINAYIFKNIIILDVRLWNKSKNFPSQFEKFGGIISSYQGQPSIKIPIKSFNITAE